MPTPFTHLEIAQKLLTDNEIPSSIRHQLCDESGAFLLGSVAADGRERAASERQDTHFYRYDQPLKGRAWRVMLGAYPSLWEPTDDSHRVFWPLMSPIWQWMKAGRELYCDHISRKRNGVVAKLVKNAL